MPYDLTSLWGLRRVVDVLSLFDFLLVASMEWRLQVPYMPKPETRSAPDPHQHLEAF